MSSGVWLARIAVAAAAGALVGMERQLHGRPAGLRTHILVAMASCVVVMAAMRLACDDQLSAMQTDVSRVVAGVVTGIGFLGAGAIIKTGDIVRGLTTAACIWFTAVMGVLAALGLLYMTGVSAVGAFLVLALLARLESHIPNTIYRDMLVTAADDHCRRTLDELSERIKRFGIEVQDTEMELAEHSGTYRILFHLRMRQGAVDGVDLVRSIAGVTSVKAVSWQRLEDL